MFELPGTPTILGMTAEEWEAFGYGLKDGVKVWKRTHLKYSEIDGLDISPITKKSIKEEFHYYEVGSDLPEDLILLAVVIYFGSTNLPAAMHLAGTFFGFAL